MRLIDADELAKKWTIASPEPYNTDAVEVLDSIREAPIVDAVVVTRCKDCKHLVAVNVNGKGIPTCRVSGMEVAPDEFCSRGEKGRR
nr:MAG TPA: hypothetical protein [Caudoviricetes sp.]